jgi:hypothetical protein
VHFAAVFGDLLLRSQNALAIVPSGPSFSVFLRGKLAAGLDSVEADGKIQEDKNIRWPSQ